MQASRSNETLILSLSLPSAGKERFQCKLGNVLVEDYQVTSIDPSDVEPICTARVPGSDENGAISIVLSCGINSHALNVNLTFEGIGRDIPDTSGTPVSNRTKTFTIDMIDDFNNIHDASCNALVPGIENKRSCNYPNIIKTQYTAKGNDIIVECDTAPDVYWHLFDTDATEENIKNRSWTRERKRNLLIKDISTEDVGKVVVCRSRSNITFAVISEIPEDSEEAHSGDPQPGPDRNNNSNDRFFIPMLLFLALWLITTAVFAVRFFCKEKQNKNNSDSMKARLNQPSNPEHIASGHAGDSETQVVFTQARRRGDPEVSNTNNSASNPTYDPKDGSTVESGVSRQSNNGSHLYFTLEKPSSSVESFQRQPTSRNDASFDQSRSSHWQGYETVRDSDKDAVCSYDLGEYAEVGDHFPGRSLLDQSSFRPSIPKKPVREEDEIARLYGKVNK